MKRRNKVYKWKIEIILNSGKEVVGYYEGSEINSCDVAEMYLTNIGEMTDKDKSKHIVVIPSQIAVMTISADRG